MHFFIAEISDYKLEIETLREDVKKFEHLESAQIKAEISFVNLEEQIGKLELEKQQSINDNKSLMEEIFELKQKIDILTKEKLEDDEVKSEISSIHLEEQIDMLELEKLNITKKIEQLLEENQKLKENIEFLNGEKHDMSIKLESYVQENIDLIDKLEKLSAEKVSSAESIEIVEALTQQEKLELEAYQNNANISTGIKNSMEHLEENLELNDSVNQLSEETSELLQKIDLFTIERREVMEKMDQMVQENNSLVAKIKKIENNRDVLVETYEHLQNEKEELDLKLKTLENHNSELTKKIDGLESENSNMKTLIESRHENDDNGSKQNENEVSVLNENLKREVEEYKHLIDIQGQEIRELKVKLLNTDAVLNEKVTLGDRLLILQSDYEKLQLENYQFFGEIEQYTVTINEKSNIEVQLKKRINEFDDKLRENLEEIGNYKSILETTKAELATSENVISDLRENIKLKENEIAFYVNEVEALNSIISKYKESIAILEEENKTRTQSDASMIVISDQLEVLKLSLNENIRQISQYEQELENNSEIINQLQNELKLLNDKILESEHTMEVRNNEMDVLKKEKFEMDTEIVALKSCIQHKDEEYHKIIGNLKEKYLILQKQIESNSESIDDIRNPLENKIQDLEIKNKEQLEKMKKIAANLKKKTIAYQELESKYEELTEKIASEEKEKDTLKKEAKRSNDLENKVQSLIEQLSEMENELANVIQKYEIKCNECDAIVSEHEALSAKYDTTCLELQTLYLENEKLKLENSSVTLSNLELSQKYSESHLQIETLQNTLRENESKVTTLASKNEQLNLNSNVKLNEEVREKEDIIKNLSHEVKNLRSSFEVQVNGYEMKIKELDMFIETQEVELSRHRERVAKLEEGLSIVEDHRRSLERTTFELGTKLLEKTSCFEEISKTEDLLERRLSALVEHDKIIEMQLKKTVADNEELANENEKLNKEICKMQNKIKDMQNNIEGLTSCSDRLMIIENENVQMKQSVTNLENDKKNLTLQLKEQVSKNEDEVNKIDAELQNQVLQFDAERKHLFNEVEKLNEQLKEYSVICDELNEGITECSQKLRKKEEEILLHKNEYDQLMVEHKNVLISHSQLVEQNEKNESIIVELKDKSSSGDSKDCVLNNLQAELKQKEIEIQEYQKQNLQLQMQASHRQTSDLFTENVEFSMINTGVGIDERFNSNPEIKNLQKQIDNLNIQKNELESKLYQTESEFDVMKQEKIKLNENLQNYGTNNIAENSVLLRDDLKQLTQKVNQLEADNSVLIQRNSHLESELLSMQQKLNFDSIKEVAEHTLNDVISTAVEKVQQSADDNLELGIDSQDNVSTHNVVTDNTKSDDDQYKIKTLEFMLYNIEKERDEALLNCQQLSNELARIVHQNDIINNLNSTISHVPTENVDKQTASVDETDETRLPDNIESQIISVDEIDMTPEDRTQLFHLEFQGSKSISDVKTQPIVEETVQAKSAYVCYKPISPVDVFGEDDDGWGFGPEESNLETSSSSVELPLSNLQFEAQINELQEKIHVLEQARERHSEELQQSQLKSGKLLKKLKEFKMKNEMLSSQVNKKSDSFTSLDSAIQDELKSQISNLEKRVKELSVEVEREHYDKNNLSRKVETLNSTNERLIEEKDKLSVEILSMQRRINELTIKLEQLEWGDGEFEEQKRSQTKVNEEDVTNAPGAEIAQKQIAELQNVIKKLQTSVNDLTLDNEELEKLLDEQRFRLGMAEKERCGDEVVQKEFDDAKNTIKELENVIKIHQDTIEEHQNTIKVISLDNEELQNLLEEQNNRFKAERAQIETSMEISRTNVMDSLNVDLLKLQEEKSRLTDQVSNVLKMNEEVKQQLSDAFLENNRLEDIVCSNIQIISDLNTKLGTLQKEYDKVIENGTTKSVDTVEEYKEKINTLVKQFGELQIENDRVVNDNLLIATDKQTLSEENRRLRHDISDKDEQNSKLSSVCTELTARIHELTHDVEKLGNLLDDKDVEIAELVVKVNEMNSEFQQKVANVTEELTSEWTKRINQLNALLGEKDLELQRKLGELNSEHEEKMSTTIEQLAAEWAQRVDERGSDVAESWKMHLDSRESEFMQIETELRRELSEIESKYNMLISENSELRRRVDSEVRNEVDRISVLEKQLMENQHYIEEINKELNGKEIEIQKLKELMEQLMFDKENESGKNKQTLQEFNAKMEDLRSLLNNKESEIIQLNNVNKEMSSLKLLLNDKEVEIENVRGENKKLLEVYNENVSLKSVFNELNTIIDAKSKMVDNQCSELEKHRILNESLQKDVNDKHTQLNDITNSLQAYEVQNELQKSTINNLNGKILDYENQISEVKSQFEQNLAHVEILNTELQKYGDINDRLSLKESEINNLKKQLQEKDVEYIHMLENQSKESQRTYNEHVAEINSLREKLAENEAGYEELLNNKQADNDNLQLQLQEVLNECETLMREKEQFVYLQAELSKKNAECEELKQMLLKRNETKSEEYKQLAELQKIIQEQVLNIETLQKELYEKSMDYDALFAEIDIAQKAAREGKLHEERGPAIVNPSPDDKDNLSEPASRAELDLALYMLHQRDVRCEELTVELMQLLEERDTLQLKLSNALREKEMLKSKVENKHVSFSDDRGAFDATIADKSSTLLDSASTEMSEEEQQYKEDASNSLTTKLVSIIINFNYKSLINLRSLINFLKF